MYAIYARQSIAKKDSVSIETQIEICRKKLPKGVTERIYIDKGYSGTNVNRPSFKKMESDINGGMIKGVLVYRLDRISRSLSDFARLSDSLAEKGVTLISCNEMLDSSTPTGMMLVKLLVMFAEMEQKTIAERLRDNYRARTAMKLPLGGCLPYGCNSAEKAETVLRIYTLYLKGMSMDKIARQLNSEKEPSPKGISWSGQQVGRILRSPAYVKGSEAVLDYFLGCGYKLVLDLKASSPGLAYVAVRSGGTTYIGEGLQEGIVEDSIWLAVQDKLLTVTAGVNRGSGSSTWLQGLVICGKCGGTCYVRSCNGGSYRYFVCSNKRKGLCAGLKAVKVQPVEDYSEGVMEEEVKRLFCTQFMDRELSKLSGDQWTQQSVLSFKALPKTDKNAAAAQVIKIVIITEESCTLILR